MARFVPASPALSRSFHDAFDHSFRRPADGDRLQHVLHRPGARAEKATDAKAAKPREPSAAAGAPLPETSSAISTMIGMDIAKSLEPIKDEVDVDALVAGDAALPSPASRPS